jgi:hypothetical protein
VYSDNSVIAGQCVYATDCPLGYRCTIDGFCVQAPPLGEGDAGMRAEAGGDAPVDATNQDFEAGDERAPDAASDAAAADAPPEARD